MKAWGRNPEKVSGPRCVWGVVGERTERRKKRKETRGRKRKEMSRRKGKRGNVSKERMLYSVNVHEGSNTVRTKQHLLDLIPGSL